MRRNIDTWVLSDFFDATNGTLRVKYLEKAGDIYEVVGIATDPTINIRNIATAENEHHVIHSRRFAEYNILEPRQPR